MQLGMDNILEYKLEVKKALLTSPEIKDLIANQTNTDWTIEQFEKRVFLFNKNPETITEEGTYVLIDVDPTRQKNAELMDYKLLIWVITSDRINPIQGKGIRTDLLVSEIYRRLFDSRKFGLGTLTSGGAPSINTTKGFSGRVMMYYITDFNRSSREP